MCQRHICTLIGWYDMRNIPMCWKCVDSIMGDSPDLPGARTLIGCKAEPAIESYGGACVLCPLLKSNEVKHDRDVCEGQRD